MWPGAKARAAAEEILPQYPVPLEVQALLKVAVEELGTAEKAGVTKYGTWAGNPQAEWCAEYLCWCVNRTDEQLGTKMLNVRYPLYGATNIGRNWFIKAGRYIARTGFVNEWGTQWFRGQNEQMPKNSYIPQPGDWVFFSYGAEGDTSHVAMVEKCLKLPSGELAVQVLEGNNPDKVQRAQYPLTDWRIQGYGTVYDLADITLRAGNEGVKVRRLQEWLQTLQMLSPEDISGRFDLRTQSALRQFQTEQKLTVSGVANRQTQEALQKAAMAYMRAHTEFWTVEEVLP